MSCPLASNEPAAIRTAEGGTTEIVRPDISWIPSYKVFKDRVERLRVLYPDRRTTLPPGWPAQIDAARVWSGSDFKSEDEYVIHLSAEDVAEIEDGLAHFKALPGNLGPDDVNPSTFPLPTLGPRLDHVSEIIHEGRGFVVLRGLQPEKYSNLDNILLYLGVTSYIAETRGMQDFDGRMILHIRAVVKDIKKHGSMPNSPYVTRAQPFHTDICDVLALYALNVAAYGGESFLASTAKIYNELARSRPDIIEVLAKDDWVFDEFWQGQYHTRPLLHNFAGHGPALQFSRRPLTGAHFSPHHPAVPAMTELQAEALDAVHFLAREHALELRLRPGDMLVLNNFAALHARSAFVDDDDDDDDDDDNNDDEGDDGGENGDGDGDGDGGHDSSKIKINRPDSHRHHHRHRHARPRPRPRPRRRHMLRLWLRNERRMWPTPPALRRLAWECYGDHARRRELAVWDVDGSPPELRVNHRRASCA